jgi:putative ABC transport system permease protein
MFVLLLVLKNAFRHKLRTTLTIVGIVVAVAAFGLLRTIVDAWYSGVNASSSARLVTRNSISLTFALPITYAQKVRQVDGVTGVAWGNWFGGRYINDSNFFPQFAISGASYLDLYPEFVLQPEERRAFLADRTGAVVGRKLANKFGWKVGDTIPLTGTIYPGTWTFNLRGIWDGAEDSTDESTMYFHYDYLNEAVKRIYPRRGDTVGFLIEGLRDPDRAAEVSQAIDATFKNSRAETLTETEKAFQLGFVSMSEAILLAIEAISYVVIVIIMAVMANTMAMSARERYSEYATLKALGFGNGFVAALIFAESLGIAAIGTALGIALTFPMAQGFVNLIGSLLSGFHVSQETMLLQLGAGALVGVVAAAIPAWRAARVRIVDGLRAIG